MSENDNPTKEAVVGFFPRQPIQWIGPIAALAIVGGLIAIAVMRMGWLSFPASSEDPEGLARIVHASFRESVATQSKDITAPDDADAEWRVQLGAAHYARNCAACHGEPGRGQNPMALSMRPRPQYLANVVDTFEPRELFWIVQNGVKFAGMPAWPHPERDDEIWSVVAFLGQIEGMDRARYLDLAYGGAVPAEGQGAAALAAYAIHNDDEPPLDEFSYTWPAVGFHTSPVASRGTASCAGCHGENGAGRAGGMAPNLTLQSPAYLAAALRSFAVGGRPSAIMQSNAAALEPAEMEQIAAQWGNGFVASPDRVEADPAGERLALEGVPSRKVPACSSCHGKEGASPDGFPRLAGQNPIYLEQQMKLFAVEKRGTTGGYDPMDGISHELTPEERKAVARYYASLPPGSDAR